MNGIMIKKRMSERIGILILIWLVMTFVTGSMFTLSAYADGTGQVTLTVKQVITGDGLSVPPDQTFTYRLTPKTAGAPMPAGSAPDGCVFTITGTGEAQIGPIDFSSAQMFAYELTCVTGWKDGYTIDRGVYTIKIYAENDAPPVTLVYTSDGGKAPEISFTHGYTTPSGGSGNSNNNDNGNPGGPGVGVYTNNPGDAGNPGAPSSPSSPSAPSSPIAPSDTGSPSSPSTPSAPSAPSAPSSPASPNPPVNHNTPGGHINPGNGPKTGDSSNPWIWISLIMACAALLALVVRRGWKSLARARNGGGRQ